MQQCEAEDPWSFIREYNAELKNATVSIQSLNDALADVTVATLNLLCNDNYEALEIMLGDAVETLVSLQLHAETALAVLACPRIVPIYTKTVYTGTCDYSIKGLTWTFSASLVIAFAGMIMLTFRSVLWNVQGGNSMEEMHEPDDGIGLPVKELEDNEGHAEKFVEDVQG